MEQIRLKIRPAELKDAINIIELLSQLDRPLPQDGYEFEKFKKIIKSYLHRPNIHNSNKGILLATIGPKIVGLLSYVLLERLNQSSPEFWIPELMVVKEYRGKGIGKVLIHKCKVLAKRNKCYRIRLESRNDRVDSHNFYRNVGFQQIALVFEKRF